MLILGELLREINYIIVRFPEYDNCVERGKRDIYYDKQVEETVTVLNCMLKGLWGEGESGGIRKKLKCKAQLICNIKIDEMIVDLI